MARPMRVGLVGASYAAATHLPTYVDLPDVEVVAVATAHQESASRIADQFGIPKAYVGYEALCEDPDIDLVDVSTRPSRHHEMVAHALGAGKHVLCEAPLAVTVAEGEELVALAQRNERLAIVDMQSRFSPGLWELRRLVRDGWLGEIENVSTRAFYPTFTVPEKVETSLWCADAAHGASTLRVHGLHTANLVEWLFGEISDVHATAATTRPVWPHGGGLEASSHDSVALTGIVGARGVYSQHSSWVAWHGEGWRLSAYGSEGALFAEAGGHTGHYPVSLRGARNADGEVRALEPAPDAFDVTEVDRAGPTYPFARLARRLARVVTEGHHDIESRRAAAREADLPDVEEGLRMLRLAEAIEGSAH